jgi:hypothetical protein
MRKTIHVKGNNNDTGDRAGEERSLKRLYEDPDDLNYDYSIFLPLKQQDGNVVLKSSKVPIPPYN